MEGTDYLRRLQLFSPSSGMWANLGLRLVKVDRNATVVECELNEADHGSGKDSTIHRGAVATIADCALASAAAALVKEGEGTATVDLHVEFLRPARPGTVVATASVTHRVNDLVFCEANVEQAGAAVAHAIATIAIAPAS